MQNEMDEKVEMTALNETETEKVAGGSICLNKKKAKKSFSDKDSNDTTYAMKFMHEC